MTKKELSHLASKIPTWPEWSDSDLNNEKWSLESNMVLPEGKSSFEDSDGRDWFPNSYGVVQWKRPVELFNHKDFCVHDITQDVEFDLITSNKHLAANELMRSIISHIMSLTYLSLRNNYVPDAVGTSYLPPENSTWRPWHHVYALCRAGKITHTPQYNPWGKYVVRLYWMGCWRKIHVDDYIPITRDDKYLLPFTTNENELWSALLTKALLKVASLEFAADDQRDFTAIEHLTGWIPERINLCRPYVADMWEVILSSFYKFGTSQSTMSDKRRGVKKSGQQIYTPFEPVFPCTAMFADICEFSNHGTSNKLMQMKFLLTPYNYSPHLRHPVYLADFRTKPFQPPKLPDDTPKWKLIRQHLWDVNYISKEELNAPIKMLGLYFPWTLSDLYSDDMQRNSQSSRSKKYKDPNKLCDSIPVQWMSYEDFCKCFNKVCVYHKLHAYNFIYKLHETKTLPKPRLSNTKLTSTSAVATPFNFTDGVPFFIFAESLTPINILLSISISGALVEMLPHKPTVFDSVISLNTASSGDKIIPSGSILVEEFDSQKQLATQIVLFLKTSSSKAAMLTLTPGRHVVSVTVRSTFGCIVNVCSNSEFILGEADVIFPKIASESLRFQETSHMLIDVIINSFSEFSNKEKLTDIQRIIYNLACCSKKGEKKRNYLEYFNIALCSLIARVVDISMDLKFALRAYTLLPYECEVFSESRIKRRKKPISVYYDYDDLSELNWNTARINRFPVTPNEKKIVMVQSYVRRFLVQNLIKARTEAGKYQSRASTQLMKLIPFLEKHRHDGGNYFLRNYFHIAPDVVNRFPFFSDECNSILHFDYSGTVSLALPAKTWVVVYRDVFHVLENSVKIKVYFHCDVTTWKKHIVDNDTSLDLTSGDFRTSQATYPKNKFGYSIVIRVFNNVSKIINTKWSLTLISPIGSLYTPMNPDVGLSSSLVAREIVDYYCPNKTQTITKYAISSPTECIITVQFVVSSPKVKLKVRVFEEDNKIVSIRDKCHVIVPAIYLHKNNPEDSTTKTYYIEVKVLSESWLIASYNLPFIQVLQLKEKLELHVGPIDAGMNELTKNFKEEWQLPVKLSRKRLTVDSKIETLSAKMSMDAFRPHWLFRVMTDSTVSENLNIRKDARRNEEIAAIKRNWENEKPGRFNSAYEIRNKFLEMYTVRDPTPTSKLRFQESPLSTVSEDSLFDRKVSIRSERPFARSATISESPSISSKMSNPTIYVVPQPLQTKIELKPWNFNNFVRRKKRDEKPILKNSSVIQEEEFIYNQVREKFNKLRMKVEEDAEKTKSQQWREKSLLYDTYEEWRMAVESQRAKLLSEREICREVIKMFQNVG